MGQIPILKAKEVIKLLKALGFIEVRQRGSHKQFRYADGRATTLTLLSGCFGNSGSGNANGSNITDGLPPDPGKAGKATLEGLIPTIEYHDSEKIRRVLTDKAKADQEFLLNADDKDKVLEADKKSSKAQQCSWYINPDTAIVRHRKLKAELLNTEERIRAWIKADSHLGGMAFSVPLPKERKAMCDFDPDQLDN